MPQIIPPMYWLRAARARVQEAGRRERTDDARNANLAGQLMDAHLHELGALGIHQLLAVGTARHGGLAGIKLADGVRLDAVRDEFGVFLDGVDAGMLEQVLELFLR